jgi:hypothetical protein
MDEMQKLFVENKLNFKLLQMRFQFFYFSEEGVHTIFKCKSSKIFGDSKPVFFTVSLVYDKNSILRLNLIDE